MKMCFEMALANLKRGKLVRRPNRTDALMLIGGGIFSAKPIDGEWVADHPIRPLDTCDVLAEDWEVIE
jgi:hypothetical protein